MLLKMHLDKAKLSDYYSYNYLILEANIMNAKDFLSATTLSKKTARTLDSLEKGDIEKLIILKNNSPKAILMSIGAYEAMEEELEDLRLTALAFARLQNFNPEDVLSHKKLMEKFAQ